MKAASMSGRASLRRLSAFERIIQSWDTANKPTELADYSVCTTWGLKAPNAYLLNVFRKRLAFPDLERAVIDQARSFPLKSS
jgi:phage terminase large subunit-like protein